MRNEYVTDKDNKVRYVLGKYNKNPLIVFGINPSTATAEKNDTTISIVEKIAEMRNADGYIMFNIYPVRATNIDKEFDILPNEIIEKKNLSYIFEKIPKGAEIIAAWGTHFCDRAFFVESLKK